MRPQVNDVKTNYNERSSVPIREHHCEEGSIRDNEPEGRGVGR
jgi:hypothetical protein